MTGAPSRSSRSTYLSVEGVVDVKSLVVVVLLRAKDAL